MTNVTPLALAEVLLITPKRHGDARGWFAETWSPKALSAAGVDTQFVQDNQAFNARKGTVRGLHFQKAPHAQGKLVRVLKGAIFDVAVDVPPGLGHLRPVGRRDAHRRGRRAALGAARLRPRLHDHRRRHRALLQGRRRLRAQLEGGLIWNDPDIGIAWPLDLAEPVLSDKDKVLPRLKDMPAASF